MRKKNFLSLNNKVLIIIVFLVLVKKNIHKICFVLELYLVFKSEAIRLFRKMVEMPEIPELPALFVKKNGELKETKIILKFYCSNNSKV